jgi:citrate synthase
LIFVNVPSTVNIMNRVTTAQAAQRLGVKPATIYAYVSRGILASTSTGDGRTSTFAAGDIEKLAQRGRPRQASKSTALDFPISTAITSISQTHLKYRGHDAVRLAKTVTFEQAAELLLTGDLREHVSWPTHPMEVPVTESVFDHITYSALTAGAADPLRADLAPESVARTARTLIAVAVDSLPILGDGRTARLVLDNTNYRATLAGRLWSRLSAKRPMPGIMPVINAALVLLADHELAVSTVAVRVAASTRANPYSVIAAGVAAMSGPMHGGASRAARDMIDDALADTSRSTLAVERAAARALAANDMYPGFGHKVYKHGDPRANLLMSMLREVAGGSREMTIVDGLIAAIKKRREIEVNVDLALAALGAVCGLPEDSGELIFSVARIAGWTAHAIEEYSEAPLRFRARAIYVG